MGAPKVTDKAISRAIHAAKDAGIEIGSVTVNNLDGTVRIEALTRESVDKADDAVKPMPKRWAKG